MKWILFLPLFLLSTAAFSTAPKQSCLLKFEICEMGPGRLQIDYRFRLNSATSRGEPSELVPFDQSGTCFEVERRVHSVSYERSLSSVSLQLFLESERGLELDKNIELVPLRYTPGQDHSEGPLTCLEYAN